MSPERMRSVKSSWNPPPQTATGMSMAWAIQVYVTASTTSYPPRCGRSPHSVTKTYDEITPKMMLVKTPARVATRYVE